MPENNGQPPQEPASQIPVEKVVPYLQQQISSLSMERAALAARCDMLLEELRAVTTERDRCKQLLDGLGDAKADQPQEAKN